MKIRRDRTGVHVFDRRTGLNLLIDDVDVPVAEWARAPRHLAVALTNACDLHCAYCYAPKHRASLDPHQLLAWLREADDAGCLGVGFGGGEPTTVKWFSTLCRAVACQTKLAVSFTTHGHRLSEALLAELNGSVHMIRVSVDGIGETYERLRGRSFGALVDRLRVLATVAPFGLNVVINEATAGELTDIAALAEDIGARDVLLLPEQPVGLRAGATTELLAALRRWVDAYVGTIRLAVSEYGSEGLPIAEPFGDQPSIERYAHIDAEGFLRPSSFAPHGVKIGGRPFADAYQLLVQEAAS